MDLSDINKVASRKRVNTEAENLREKMSRETSKIIKLRVAQDTAYWELQERLGGVRGEHERLQRNMLDLQMQHEALSARFEREQRARPAAAARLRASRALADTLHAHAARLRPALARAAADRAALAASYAAAARRVHAAHAGHHAAAEAARRAAAAHADRADLSAQLATCAETARRHAEEALGAERDSARDLRARADEQRARADTLQASLHEAERAGCELRREAERRAAEAAAAADRAALGAADLQRRLEERDAALREARRELAAAEASAAAGAERAARSRDELQKLERNGDDLRRELESVGEANGALREEIRRREREARERAAAAEAARAEAEAARAQLQAERAAAGEALAERADAVARLMRDVAGEAEARARAEGALQAAEERARALASDVQRKEEDLAGQTKIILEMRSEKERLQDIIGGMQGTIDNIQKELTREGGAGAGPAAAAAARREPPEHDDNALPAPPAPLSKGSCAPGMFRAPPPRAQEDLLYQFLSDSSMDADALDPKEVNARFEALSRGAAPAATSLRALKRRAADDAQAHADMSLSQVKTEMAARGRTFFRNKRLDTKPKKLK